MKFKDSLEKNFWYNMGKNAGFGFSLFLFFSIFYLILLFFYKIKIDYLYFLTIAAGLFLLKLIIDFLKK